MRLMPAALAAVSLALAAGAADAASIKVENAWIAAPPPGATTAAGYLTITNSGPTSDRFTGVATEAAASAEIHHMSTAGGVMRMRQVKGGVPIGAGATLRLSPNGYHLMLVGLKHPLAAGQHVKATLQFERASPVSVDFAVRAPAGGMAGM
jgi:copper(I)-binding protein